MTTTTLMRITRDTEGLGGITNDRGSVNVARVTSIPGATTPEQGLVRSAAEAFLLAVLKERRLRLRGADGGGEGVDQTRRRGQQQCRTGGSRRTILRWRLISPPRGILHTTFWTNNLTWRRACWGYVAYAKRLNRGGRIWGKRRTGIRGVGGYKDLYGKLVHINKQ